MMKRLYFTTVFLFSLFFSFAAPKVIADHDNGTFHKALDGDIDHQDISVEKSYNKFIKAKMADHPTEGRWVLISKIINNSIISFGMCRVNLTSHVNL